MAMSVDIEHPISLLDLHAIDGQSDRKVLLTQTLSFPLCYLHRLSANGRHRPSIPLMSGVNESDRVSRPLELPSREQHVRHIQPSSRPPVAAMPARLAIVGISTNNEPRNVFQRSLSNFSTTIRLPPSAAKTPDLVALDRSHMRLRH